jgi:endosialidase-like protein
MRQGGHRYNSLVCALAFVVACLSGQAYAQLNPGYGLTIGTVTLVGGATNGLLYNNAGVLGNLATANSGVLVTSGAGAPSISSTLPSGIAATNMTLTTPSLGVATATSINGNTFTTGTYTLTGVAGKTLTFNKTMTLTAPDDTAVSTLPAGSHSLAPLDSPSFTTPTLGVAASTSLALGGCTIGSNALCVTGSTATGAHTLTPVAAATISTDQAQAVGGTTLLAFASTTGAAVGQQVSGTSVPLGDTVASIVATAQVTLTANGISNSGQKVLTTTATAGSAVGQQCTDLTTPTAIGAGNVIASIQAGTSITMTSNLVAATANNDSIVCDPVVTLSTATTAAVGAAASINFFANHTTLSASSAFADQGDASIYGALVTGGPVLLNASNATGSVVAPNVAFSAPNNGFWTTPANNQDRLVVYGTIAASFFTNGVEFGQTSNGPVTLSNNVATPYSQTSNNSATSGTNGHAVLSYRASTTVPAALYLGQSNSSTVGTQAAVASGTQLGQIVVDGSDGTNFQDSAIIRGEVDNTVSAGVVPGRIKILTASATGVMTQAALFDSTQNTTLAGTLTAGNIQPSATTAPTVGMALPAAGKLGLYGTTSELFSGATDVLDYGVSTASVLTTGVATTVNSATFKVTTLAAATAIDTVCYTTVTGLFTEEPTGTTCTVSDETKKVGIHPLRWVHSILTILRSSPISYYYLPEMGDPDYHLGFGAQTMEKIAPELVHYEEGKPKAIKQLELLPVTWAAIKELAWGVIGLFAGVLLLAVAVIDLYRRNRAMQRRLVALESRP